MTRGGVSVSVGLVVKFFADEMLGKLARWLRMAGVDVAYARGLSDAAMLVQCRGETRVLLTRDTRIITRLSEGEFLSIIADRFPNQFAEFERRFPGVVAAATPFSRCVECNVLLHDVPKTSVKDRVWPHVFATQEHFTVCDACGRVYWRATHVERIKKRLRELMRRS